MTDLLNFLERMGTDSRLRDAAGQNLVRVLTAAGIDGAASRAILTADQGELESLLGASTNVFCSLHTPPEPPADEPTSPGDDGEEPQPGGGSRTVPRKKKKGGKKKPAKKKPAKRSPVKKKAPKKKPVKKKGSKKKSPRKKK